MALSAFYARDELQSTIVQEETWLQGTLLSNLFFGVQSTLFFSAFLSVFQRRTLINQSRRRVALLTYIAVLFAVTTAAQGLLLQWIQMAFVTQRNYPGGPSAFLNDEYSIPVNLVSTILVVCANWMMESLMVWRCKVVCSTGESLWWLGVAIPLLLLAGVFVSGSLFIHNILHSAPQATYVLVYGVSSLALNLTTTAFIAGRLLVHRRRIVRYLGRGHGQHYVSVVAVLVESAAIYSGFLLIVIVAYAVGSPATNLLQQLVEQVQTITSLLIILRVARGEGWCASTDTQLISAAVSSLDTRVAPPSQQNVVQLQVISTRREDEEAESTPHKMVGRTVSFTKQVDEVSVAGD